MPELPEVESVRRSLEPLVLGRVITRAEVRRRDFCVVLAEKNSRGASPAEFLENARVTRLERLGKQIAIVAADGRSVCLQLGMSGYVDSTRGDDPAHTHAAWTLDSGERVRFVDPRRFGGLTCYPTFESLRERQWAELGPDALETTPEHLIEACRDARRAIKAVLLDQGVVAGVGNIYADESLFLAGIDPRTMARRVAPERLARLAESVRLVLARAVELRGSTLRDYRDPSGQPGSAQTAHAVYGRGGEACVRCTTTLRSCRVSQRATVWCPSCQRRGSLSSR
ncbi:MAG: bifunctional DNA-formamidopyrimidine glycosylase/DNA-(apurinic or apyrimidinic site) lyase [Phycisphaerales bacterium]|nr:bifunctional DNA-formamidopyrimidine glycosylase/DNA-(apurinic or apyrimidinic site) lyase [Phycisphaerales bacterium]